MTNTGQAKRTFAASARKPGGVASQRSTVVRMNLFVLVRILFQYLERVDPSSLNLAKEVLKDCERKHNTKDSKYETLADAINERVRDAVGESHWTQARKIQKQLMINQQRKKLKAMKGQAAKKNSASQRRPVSQQKASNEALEAAETMSALAQAAPSRDSNATPPRSNNSSRFKSLDPVDEEMGDGSRGQINQDPSSAPR
eukprot:CAMPEP_0181123582 /NCGR_PEP_ID=MMETSP1071-20121207/25986_1 /TAXON_ID=35127 /ORGANISM="Thalassiosira sp., Strain NH16" /LENGTH=199 /DNA_ID=CAMNT_0023208753 /DNA_START=68 /DNA_END=664 /DNA_ORIENTATION=-